MAMNSSSSLWNRSKPYVAVVFLRAGYAGMSLLGKNALNHGLNNYSFFVYRQIIAAAVIAPFALVLERKVRPKMTLRLFAKILLLAFFPVMDQNLYFLGMKYTSATFAMALVNILPALTFVMAWVFRLETVNIKSIRSQAKIIGTVVTIGGAMVMTLVKGPIIPTPWNDSGKGGHGHAATNTLSTHDMIMGAILVTSGCTAWASFVIFQYMLTAKVSNQAQLNYNPLSLLAQQTLYSPL